MTVDGIDCEFFKKIWLDPISLDVLPGKKKENNVIGEYVLTEVGKDGQTWILTRKE